MMDAMTQPRSRSGERYHQIGTDAYAVVLNAAGQEVSERHPGTMWISLGREVGVLFRDECGHAKSTFTVTESAPLWRLAIFVDGDLAVEQDGGGSIHRRGTVSVDFSEMYDRMA